MSANQANLNKPVPPVTPDHAARADAVRELDALLGETVPPLIAEGRRTFHGELPDLLRRHAGTWVAYSGSRRLGIGRTKTQLNKECLRQGLNPGEFIVLSVEPECDDGADLPLDV